MARNRQRPHRPKFYNNNDFEYEPNTRYHNEPVYHPPRRNLIGDILINHASFFVAAFFGAVGFGINFYYEAQDAHKEVAELREEIDTYKDKVAQLEARAQLESMMKNTPLPITPPGR